MLLTLPSAFMPEDWSGPTAGLTHRWPMNDANVSGSTIIDIVAGTNGSAGTGVTSTQGPVTQSRAIANSTGGIITLTSNPLDFSSSFTVGYWFWRSSFGGPFDSPTGNARIFNFTNASTLDAIAGSLGSSTALPVNNGLIFGTASTGIAVRPSTFAIPLSTWSHFSVTFNGTTPIAYFNAVSVAFSTSNGGDGVVTAAPNGNCIGSVRNTTSNRPFGGDIYQLVLYNRALASSEITQLYNAK